MSESVTAPIPHREDRMNDRQALVLLAGFLVATEPALENRYGSRYMAVLQTLGFVNNIGDPTPLGERGLRALKAFQQQQTHRTPVHDEEKNL